MRLLELFDKTGTYKWRTFSDEGGAADIVVGGHSYDLTIDEADLKYYEGMADNYAEGGLPEWLSDLANDYSVTAYYVEFVFEDRQGVATPSEYGKHGLTGTGNQYAVFATVMKAMKEFANKFHVEYWVFSANEPSRQSLYDKMAGRFGRGVVHTFTLDNNSIAGEKFYVVQAT